MRNARFLLLMTLFAGVLANAQQNVPGLVENNQASNEDAGGEVEPAVDFENTELGRALAESEAAVTTGGSNYTPERVVAYNDWVLDQRKRAYEWQHTSTIAIFFVVMVMVCSGVILAAWQLRAWLGRVADYDQVFLDRLGEDKEVSTELVAEIGKQQNHQVDVKAQALGVSTPYVGVAILGLSMGFFLAYLVFVYPILVGP